MIHERIIAIIFSTALLAPNNLGAVAPGAGDGGCCVPDSMISQMAEAYDVEGKTALDMMEVLAGETFADLRLLQSTPAQACEVYLMCDEVPDEFFRVRLNETIERQKAAALNAEQRSAFIFTLLTAVLAVVGLALGVFNTWRSLQEKDKKVV